MGRVGEWRGKMEITVLEKQYKKDLVPVLILIHNKSLKDVTSIPPIRKS